MVRRFYNIYFLYLYMYIHMNFFAGLNGLFVYLHSFILLNLSTLV